MKRWSLHHLNHTSSTNISRRDMLYMWHSAGKSRWAMGGSIKQRGDPPDVRGRSSTTQPDATSIPPLPQCGTSTYTQLARAVLFRTRLWKPKMFARTAIFIFAANHLVKVWIVWRLLISRATVAFIACSLYAAAAGGNYVGVNHV